MNKALLSFADKVLWRSLKRLSEQAEKIDYFDRVFLYDENSFSPEFRRTFRNKLSRNVRGFGYWCWKPELIYDTLLQLDWGDLLLYLDAGCHLNSRGRWRLEQYFSLLNESEIGMVGFQAEEPSYSNSPLEHDGRTLFDQPNYKWIKGDLFDHFGVRENKRFTHSQAIGAGIILVRKCEASLSIVDEWRSIIRTNFSLLDDSPSISSNFEGFIEHRHDQAIFTLLCLKHDVPLLSAYEYWYPKKVANAVLEPDWDVLKNFPIHARRDKDVGKIVEFKTRFLRVAKLPFSLLRRSITAKCLR